jgi:hypothetical protein
MKKLIIALLVSFLMLTAGMNKKPDDKKSWWWSKNALIKKARLTRKEYMQNLLLSLFKARIKFHKERQKAKNEDVSPDKKEQQYLGDEIDFEDLKISDEMVIDQLKEFYE